MYSLSNFYWQSLREHSSHADTKLHSQTYENIFIVKSKWQISTAIPDKTLPDLSLHANNSKSLFEPGT